MTKKTTYLHQIPRIHDSIEHLLGSDPVFSRLKLTPRDLLWPYHGPGFAGLVRIVIGQQISVHAARALWERFEAGMPCVTPNSVVMVSNDEMRTFGLSHQKARYIRGLAEAVNSGAFDPDKLAAASDAQVYQAITALSGFGPWSAEMYLMFGLARPDVWPAGDLGIQTGLQHYLRLKERPDRARTLAEGARFAPHRTAASLLLWYIKGAGGLAGKTG